MRLLLLLLHWRRSGSSSSRRLCLERRTGSREGRRLWLLVPDVGGRLCRYPSCHPNHVRLADVSCRRTDRSVQHLSQLNRRNLSDQGCARVVGGRRLPLSQRVPCPLVSGWTYAAGLALLRLLPRSLHAAVAHRVSHLLTDDRDFLIHGWRHHLLRQRLLLLHVLLLLKLLLKLLLLLKLQLLLLLLLLKLLLAEVLLLLLLLKLVQLLLLRHPQPGYRACRRSVSA